MMNPKENIIEFGLNPKFYSKESILDSINSFEDICTCKFDEKTFNIVLDAKEKCDIERLANEFRNHCLAFMK